MKRLLFVLSLAAAISLTATAQQLARFEYWFDHNSDHRIQTSYADSIIAIKADANGLLTGIHSFSFRALDSEGRWSSPFTSYFLHVPSGQAAWTYEYWFDGDQAHRTTQQGTGCEANLLVDANALPVGIHSLHFRAHDEAGRWSSPLTAYFMRMQIGAAAWTYEYWFDNDHAHCVSGQGTGDVLSLDISAQHLSVGIHSFNFRAKDEAGRWSVPVTTYFFRAGNDHDPAATYTYEYWLDETGDQKVSGFSADGLISLEIDASRLKAGIHFLAIRIKDDHGRWASPLYHYFVKPHTRVDNLVAAYYYWYNGHVEDAQLVRLSEPASPLLLDVDLPTNNLTQEVTRDNITMLTTANGQQQLAMKNVLSMQFMDERGQWSTTLIDTFAVSVGNRVVSLTPFIVNPEADEQWQGWTTQGSHSIQTDGHWSGEADNYFHLNSGTTMRQTISGLPAGTYVLAANGRTEAGGQLTLEACGYTTTFDAADNEDNDLGQGWSQRSLSFVTDGEPFNIVATATGGWADIDGYQLTVNGLMDRAGTIALSDVGISDIAEVTTWNEVGSPVLLTVDGLYTNKKGRTATIYCTVDNGTPIRIANDIASGSRFGHQIECFFRQNANPHTLTFYARDGEGVTSEQVVIEIGNATRAINVEGLPQVALYTGSAITSDSVRITDSRTGELLTEGEDYTLLYKDNVDDGQATLVVEGVYPRYLGRKEVAFTIKSAIAPIELAVLRQLYRQTAGDSLWVRKWEAIGHNQVLSDELPGVSVRNCHVTAIHLRGNRLTGTIPPELLSLTQLQVLNMENNSLQGIVYTNGIQPALRELLLAGNSLSHLSGVVPATVERLTIGSQTIASVQPFHLAAAELAQQATLLPNIGLYDHQQQSFNRNADISVMADGYDSATLAMISRRDGNWQFNTDKWGRRDYAKAQGDTIYCRDDAGNRFRMALTYDMGDANIDALVNVQDLAAMLMYCLNNWQATFNRSAANLWQDETINVQDAICLVNLLLDGIPPSTSTEQSEGSRLLMPAKADAMVACTDGRLMLQSIVPVSAFDVVLQGVRPEDVTSLIEPLGFVISMKQQAGSVHMVGYSPSGTMLPAGETALVMVNSSKASVSAALLADDHAHALQVLTQHSSSIRDLGSDGSVSVILNKGMVVVTTAMPLNNVEWTLLTATGTVLDSGHISSLPSGISRIDCRTPRHGVCLLRLKADGRQTVVQKVHIR
ncbi:MAG: hypothetical protein IJT98_04095 [Prevotella sp.]|nr:hypothetical protein [Prevotella sp.]